MTRRTMTLLLALLWWPLAAPATSEPELPELQAHEITRGEFTQQRHLPELSRALESSGRFVHDVDRGIMWQVLEPAPSTLVITPRGLYRNGEHQGSSNPMTTLRPVFRALFSGDMDRLTDYFKVSRREAQSGWALALQPRDSNLAAVVATISLAGDEYPREVVIHDGEGGRTVLRFSALEHPASLSQQERQAFSRVH